MNYLKRIEIKKRPQHFQQGGNIAIGSPKPYTTTLPGVNFNPLTLNNAPIEINTTGISDQINKMRQLAFDREALAFKYKELEYKEGADYLDFMADIMKSVNGVGNTVRTAGGVASISPRFKDVLAERDSARSSILEQTARDAKVKDKNALSSLPSKIAGIQSNKKYLEAEVMAGAMDKIIDEAGKGGFGIGTQTIMDEVIRYINNDDTIDPMQIIAKANHFRGLSVTAKDETAFINNFLKPVYENLSQKEVVKILDSGMYEKTKTSQRPDLAKVKGALRSMLTGTQEGMAALQARGINPKNPSSADLDTFINTVVDAYDVTQEGRFAPDISVGGSPQEGIEVDPKTGAVTKKPDAKGGSQTDADKEVEDYLEEINRKYGPEAKVNMSGIIRSILDSSDTQNKWPNIEKKLLEDGFQRLDGKSPEGAAESYRGKSTGLVPRDVDVEEIVKAIKKSNTKIDTDDIRDNTVVVNKDGKTYLITSDNDVKNSIKNLWPKTKIHKENEDDDVVWKDYGIENRWNMVDEKNTTIFELEDAPKRTSSTYKGSNVDPKEAAKELNSAGAANISKGKFWSAYQDSVATNPNFKVQK